MDLHEASWKGSIDDIESAIDEGCDVNAPGRDGKTPLWLAVQKGHSDACNILLARGARVEEERSSILELAVQREHTEIVRQLWPHCKAERQHRCLEIAISLGFHEIADFLLGTPAFEYQHCQAGDIEKLVKDGFPRRGSAAFQQWERFIFVRRLEKLNLHHVFFDYALLLATKADRNAGLRLEETETPLTNAAEKGNLEVLGSLIERPDIHLTICGKYNWPAFLHLLASSESIASEQGWTIARALSKNLPDSFMIDSKGTRLETVFKNVLRLGDDALVKQVIDLVRGAAGIFILPLLIRANDTHGLSWILNSDIAHAAKPPPILWVLLCNFFQRNPSSEALKTFVRVAQFLVERTIWDRNILVCLNSRNLCFVQHLFYPLNEIPPREVAEETLAGLSQALTDQSLVEEWVDKGFANAALWSAILSGVWKSPAFESLLSCPGINLEEPFPRKERSEWGEANDPSSPFSGISAGNSAGEKRRFPFRPPAGEFQTDTPKSNALQDYQMQLMFLEQQNKRRLMMAREEQMEVSMGKCLVAGTGGKSPLAWAVANRNTQLVDALLRGSRVNVNSQDARKQNLLMHAIAVNDWQTVQKLLKIEDIDLNLRDDQGRTAIFHAAQREDVHIIQLLTGTQKVDFSIRGCNGESVQDIARKIGKRDVMAALAT